MCGHENRLRLIVSCRQLSRGSVCARKIRLKCFTLRCTMHQQLSLCCPWNTYTSSVIICMNRVHLWKIIWPTPSEVNQPLFAKALSVAKIRFSGLLMPGNVALYLVHLDFVLRSYWGFLAVKAFLFSLLRKACEVFFKATVIGKNTCVHWVKVA